jgi:16S rRNA (cytidine1402-2'-O)-methyltransferase
VKAQTGTLYIVATPIGNVDDISSRACSVLADVQLIAAEDTRHTARLLQRLGIRNELVSCHEHNEVERAAQLISRLEAGEDVALVSDAGTPLVSDPGYRIVGAAIEAGICVTPVPGCSAVMAALSVAGLPTDSVLFGGFLPSADGKRRARLTELAASAETLVLFESVHRIRDSIAALSEVLGPDRQAIAARELTKLHESIYRGSLAELVEQLEQDPGSSKGEYTLVIAGAPATGPDDAELDRVLGILLAYLGVRQAADSAAKILDIKKNAAYKRALELREESDGGS